MDSQLKAVLEGQVAFEHRINERIDTRFQQVELRLATLEFAVRKNSEDIRQNSEDIVALQIEVRRLAGILHADDNENAVEALERRVKALEARVGI